MDAKIIPGPGAKTLAKSHAKPGVASGAKPSARPSTKSPSSNQSERHSIQSVDRALLLLETIAELGGEATLTELSNRTQLNISTCHHLLATLIKRNFAAKVPGKRLYTLGSRLLTLSHACLQVDLPRRAEAYLESINRVTGETVHLAARHGDIISNIAVREARHAVRVETGKLGKIPAPHAQTTGKAILAWLPDDEARRILGGSIKRYTDKTITEYPQIIEMLRQVRRTGYAVDQEEYLPGVICIGAAIRDQTGAVIGSISASTPKMRATEEHLNLIRTEVLAAARALSADFGAPGISVDRARAAG